MENVWLSLKIVIIIYMVYNDSLYMYEKLIFDFNCIFYQNLVIVEVSMREKVQVVNFKGY